MEKSRIIEIRKLMEQVDDLIIQATKEKSHYYTGSVLKAVRQIVPELLDECERLQADSTHSCHDECKRLACVLRRENTRLREALDLAKRQRDEWIGQDHDDREQTYLQNEANAEIDRVIGKE